MLRSLGHWEAAIASLERARALAPQDPNVLVNLGNVYRSSGARKRFKGCGGVVPRGDRRPAV
ncbi:MAG: tetratricopeptide repeat protein [Rhodospirillales bacterium]